MFLLKTRRERESVIVQAMIEMYCMESHKSVGSLCKECQLLSVYAEKRLLSCMYGEIKPVCKHCPVHCYSPPMREQMRLVMSWAGPRMIYRKPVFAVIHFIDNLTAPKSKKKSTSNSIKRK
jgi:hypothetical protein